MSHVLNKVCRGCLSSGDDVKFEKLGNNARYFQEFLNINVLKDEPKPMWLICRECSYRISTMLSLTDKIAEAVGIFSDVLMKIKNGQSVSADIFEMSRLKLRFPALAIHANTSVIGINYEEQLSAFNDYKQVSVDMIVTDVTCEKDDVPTEFNIDGIEVKKEEIDDISGYNGDDFVEDFGADSDDDMLKEIQDKIKSAGTKQANLSRMKKRMKKQHSNSKDKNVTTVYLSKEEVFREMQQQSTVPRYKLSDFKCELCCKGFTFESAYHEHMGKHSKSCGRHKCEFCKQYFESGHALRIHQQTHYRRYKCRECAFVRSCWGVVADHYVDAHERDGMCDIQCNVCGKTFTKHNTFRKHACRQEKIKCEFCEKMMLQASVKEHVLRMHTNDKPYECAVCQKRFAKSNTLRMHVSQRHPDAMEYCAECNLFFANKSGLRNHLRLTLKHIKEENLKQCPHCPVRLPYWKCSSHIERVHNKRQFACAECGVQYISRSSLSRHRKAAHLQLKKERKYVCETCGKGFTVKKTLTSHMNIHTGARPFVCPVCMATFAHPAALYTHNRIVHLKVKRKNGCKATKLNTEIQTEVVCGVRNDTDACTE